MAPTTRQPRIAQSDCHVETRQFLLFLCNFGQHRKTGQLMVPLASLASLLNYADLSAPCSLGLVGILSHAGNHQVSVPAFTDGRKALADTHAHASQKHQGGPAI